MTPTQWLSRAKDFGPRPGTELRTQLRLEDVPGPRGGVGRGRIVSREAVERLAQRMAAAGAPISKARNSADVIAMEAHKFISTQKAWEDNSDAAAIKRAVGTGQLAFALREAVGAYQRRDRQFWRESVAEDAGNLRADELEVAGLEFLRSLESAARKIRPRQGRPPEPARELWKTSAAMWMEAVGKMPTRSSDRVSGERTGALFMSVREMVGDAAHGLPDQKRLVHALSDRTFRAAIAELRMEQRRLEGD